MSSNERTDKRVIKTKDSLKRALVTLLSKNKENKLENISIITLTDEAGINRKTFYLHYKDVLSVYKEIVTNLQDKLVNAINSMSLETIYSDQAIFNVLYLIKNDEFVSSIIKDSVYSRKALFTIENIIVETIYERYLQAQPANPKLVLEPLQFNVYGCLKVFYNYLRSKEDFDLKTLASRLANFTYKIRDD